MAEEVAAMSAFEPPLRLAGATTVVIRSLGEASDFLRDYHGRWPTTRNLILRRLNAASTERETDDAAKTFRWWAGLEGLLQPEQCLQRCGSPPLRQVMGDDIRISGRSMHYIANVNEEG